MFSRFVATVANVCARRAVGAKPSFSTSVVLFHRPLSMTPTAVVGSSPLCRRGFASNQIVINDEASRVESIKKLKSDIAVRWRSFVDAIDWLLSFSLSAYSRL